MNLLERIRPRELANQFIKQTARRLSCGNTMNGFPEQVTLGKRNRHSASNSSLNNLVGASQRKNLLARKHSIVAPQPQNLAYNRNHLLSESVRLYIEDKARLTGCKAIHICDGSELEREQLIKQMADQGIINQLDKYENCWLARTDPKDVARVECRTFICTRNKHDVVPKGFADKPTVALGNWMDIKELDERMAKLLPNCMAGRTMYVIPFSMGPIGSSMSKVGIQVTDSPYVVASMHIMTRVSLEVLRLIKSEESDAKKEHDYVRCFHSVGCPLPSARPIVNNWPCNPEETIITHIPERKEIISYGSGYGGNSLLGKKCFALRLGSILGRDEGWLAEHMLILGITDPSGNKRYIAAAFPSACGKTNLAMLTPTLPGYKVECVGDDIAWMRFDENGVLRAINPEAGFFGVAPGTNEFSNPNAMKTIERNTIFTNVAETSDGDFYWEGLEHKLSADSRVTDWQNTAWDPKSDKKAAHPNSRFCAPASQCPIIDPQWESSEGVPISAIIFGGRRPEGVPLVYESFDWSHGVFLGASMRSETTAAAEHKGKLIVHDPFAMRPFFGYNFGHYLKHWLSMAKVPNAKLPKIFHVNWFGRDTETGNFLWPGYGENIRVLDWICRRISGERCARPTPIGLVPEHGALNLEGLKEEVDMGKLFLFSSDFWSREQQVIENFLRANVGEDLPKEIEHECKKLKQRLVEYASKQADRH